MVRALAVLTIAFALVVVASPAGQAATIQVTDAWTRATPGQSSNAAVYFTMTNTGKAADKLVSAETGAAETCELHETSIMDGMSHMGMSGAVEIAPGANVSFAPNGRHLMLTGLKKPLHKGDDLAVTLHFEKAGTVSAKVQVLDVASTGPHSH